MSEKVFSLQLGLRPSFSYHLNCVFLFLCISSRIYSLNSIPNNRFLKNFLRRFGLLTKPLPKICWQAIVEEILFHISFCWSCLTWSLNRSLTCNKPTHYPLAYDDFLNYSWHISCDLFNLFCLNSTKGYV